MICNKPMKKPKISPTVRITLRIPRSDASKLRHHATSKHQSLSQTVENLLLLALGHSSAEPFPEAKESPGSENAD